MHGLDNGTTIWVVFDNALHAKQLHSSLCDTVAQQGDNNQQDSRRSRSASQPMLVCEEGDNVGEQWPVIPFAVTGGMTVPLAIEHIASYVVAPYVHCDATDIRFLSFNPHEKTTKASSAQDQGSEELPDTPVASETAAASGDAKPAQEIDMISQMQRESEDFAAFSKQLQDSLRNFDRRYSLLSTNGGDFPLDDSPQPDSSSDADLSSSSNTRCSTRQGSANGSRRDRDEADSEALGGGSSERRSSGRARQRLSLVSSGTRSSVSFPDIAEHIRLGGQEPNSADKRSRNGTRMGDETYQHRSSAHVDFMGKRVQILGVAAVCHLRLAAC
jgi:hypothetical protein